MSGALRKWAFVFLLLTASSLVQVLASPFVGDESHFIVPLDAEDAVVYFNYFNNISNARMPFSYAGYVSLPQQFIAWVASFLPIIFQLILYPVCGVALAVIMFRQIEGYCLDRDLLGPRALVMALIATLVTQVLLSTSLLSLGYSPWCCFLAAVVYFVRVLFGGNNLRPASFGFFLFLALATPVSLTLVLVFSLALIRQRAENSTATRLWCVLGVLALVVYGLTVSGGLEKQDFSALLKAGLNFEWTWHPRGWIGFAMLGAALTTAIRRGEKALNWDLILPGIGVAASVLYFLSERFLTYRDFFGRYTVPLAVLCLVYTVTAGHIRNASSAFDRTAARVADKSIRSTPAAVALLILCLIMGGYWYVASGTFTFAREALALSTGASSSEVATTKNGNSGLCLWRNKRPAYLRMTITSEPYYLPCDQTRIHLGQAVKFRYFSRR